MNIMIERSLQGKTTLSCLFTSGIKIKLEKMGLTKRHLRLCWYILILAVLTYPSEEETIKRTKRFQWDKIEETAKRITNSISTKLTTIFNRQSTVNSNIKMTEDSLSTTTVLPSIESRQIIVAPTRCPPNHVVINGKCRLNIEGI
ncbi:secapin-like [Vespa crabro]|uniref:secapin-like n=1 Tax=Vespa crabro TaxID=7445 RepID=UPI001F0283AD|nr:secapin-like [Vespa crabro]XP_046825751.1 secapin-like [Vespa crabro]XP_046825752.1 secapin-like [Vespa crabro]